MSKPEKQQLPAVKRLEAALACILSPETERDKAVTDLFVDSAQREAEAAGRRGGHDARAARWPNRFGLMLTGRRNTDRRLLEIASSLEAILQRPKHTHDIEPFPIES